MHTSMSKRYLYMQIIFREKWKKWFFSRKGLTLSAGRTEDFLKWGGIWIGCDNRNEMQRAESAQGLGSSHLYIDLGQGERA